MKRIFPISLFFCFLCSAASAQSDMLKCLDAKDGLPSYLLYTLLIVGALVLLIRLVQRRERRKFRIRQMQEEAKKNAELNRMKFRFFTNVSHELRTPLTLIISPLEGMMQHTTDEHQLQQLRMMHRNALRLLHLVNQLLDYRENEIAERHLSSAEVSLSADASSDTPAEVISDVAPSSAPSFATPETSDDTTKPLALVVDGHADMQLFMRDSLSLYFRVHTAANGREAWQMIPDLMPDIIVSDVLMSEMDGNELCRWVKSDPRTQHIPFILLTPKQSLEEEVESLTIGADDCVTKPFSIDLLVLRMNKLIALSTRNRCAGFIDPEPGKAQITSLDEQLVTKAVKYIEEHIESFELTVEELSASLGMSRTHLYKKLLQITGKTPIEFIRVIRLKRAAQFLRESRLNIAEVAYAVGFSSPKAFTKYFCDEFGVLPSVYLKNHTK